MKIITPLIVSLALAATLTVQSALYAQQLPIQAAPDGTGTIVNSAGNTFNITGGTTSSSGTNLFHSFTTFGLNNGQVADFLTAPSTQNILSRVTGGSSSLIDGLLKVSGSNANLFLLNPSGIIFGPNATLNVPAAFTATTANGIAFGSQWFNALGQNNYAALNGSPGALGFTMSKPGAIINAGNLSVGPGQALSLIGGTVASTGQLSGGQVTVAAVPGEHYVRLGQPGSPLSIEVPISGAQLPTNWDLPISSLPELLTGTNAGLTVADDGTVQLTNSQLTVKNGDVVARKIDAESATLSANRNVTLPESQLETTKDLLIQAKDTVTARDSKENPVLVKAAGNLTIQGDKSVDLLALNHPGQAFQSGGDLRLVSDGNVSGDAHFGSGGTFSIETLAGKPGNFVSLYDPIISSGNDVSFGNYEGVALKIESGGSITGGNITITGPDTTLAASSDPDIPTLNSSAALILRAGVKSLGNGSICIPQSCGSVGENFTSLTFGNLTTSPGNITLSGNVSTIGGPIILAAPGDITTKSLSSSSSFDMGGAISVEAQGNITTGSIDSTAVGPGGDVSLNATNGSITTESISSTGEGSSAGAISLSATNGSIKTDSLRALSIVSTGGAISVEALGNITTGNIESFSSLSASTSSGFPGSTGNGGTISLNTTNGSISTGNLISSSSLNVNGSSGSTGNGGTISLNATNGSITTGNIDSSTLSLGNGSIGNGGTISLAANSNITTGNIDSSGGTGGGDISLTAPQGVNLDSVNSGSGNITISSDGSNFINGTISGTGSLALQQFTPSNSITINGSVLSHVQNGFGSITVGRPDSTGNFTVVTPITFSDPLTLLTPGGSIFVNSQITGADDASLTFISSDATTVLNANVITNGNPITFGNSVRLGNTVTVETTGGNAPTGAPITFAKTVNATTAGGQGLTVNAGSGNASFNGPVGNIQPLSTLTVNAGNISLSGIGTTTQAGVIGNTNLKAPGSILFGGNTYNANTQTYISSNNIVSNPGNNITFTASSDPITFQGPITLNNSGLTIASASTIATDSISGTGPINFTADNNINTNTGNITTNGRSIDLTSQRGAITVGNLTTNGGEIALTSGGLITAGTINSSTSSGGAPITLRHQGTAFIVNGPQVNGFSSSRTITSSPNNGISNGFFTGIYKKGDISIIGPGGPNDGTDGKVDPQTIKNTPPFPVSGPSTPILPRQPSSSETVKSFEDYFGEKFTQKQFSIPQLQENLERLEKATGKKLAIINIDAEAKILTLITPADSTVVTIPLTVTSEALRDKATLLRREIADPSNVTSSRYLTASRQLYSWLIAPLEANLQAKKINTLIFQLDSGLRLMPLAALNDGKQFLVEKYSLSLIPSINLLDTRYEPERFRESKVLAMGAAIFKDDVPLPAVPAELQNVSQETGGGGVFLNESFTLGNLKSKTTGYGLVHLATHADFNRGPVQGSYIKLSDTRLSLNQMRDLGWNQQNVELLVLSACRTAFGDVNTELGFAGLAVASGVKTAVATLWRSSDIGTFSLMSDFYDELKTASIKADALRSAQVAMLRGEVHVEKGQLLFKKRTFPLPADLKALGDVRLTHPYYWSGFTMIGSPW